MRGEVHIMVYCPIDTLQWGQTHSALEHFICNYCSKDFYYNCQLNGQREVKHEGKRFQCDICDKGFAKEKNLTMHKEKKHEGLRYDCDDCDFQSVSRKSLKSHKNWGIGVDCYICENKYSNTWS